MKFIRNNKALSAGIGLSTIGLLAWLAFGFFGIQAAFIDNVVDEDGPVFAVAAPAAAQPTTVPTTAPLALQPVTQTDAPDAIEVTQAPAVEPTVAPAPVEVATPEPTAEVEPAPAADPVPEPATAEPAPAEAAAQPIEPEPTPTLVPVPTPAAQPTPVPTATPVPEPTPAPQPATPGEVVTLFSGQFRSLNNYSVAGDVAVLGNGTDQRFLRFENFASDNGPDLKVYLRAANGDFISLGDLSGNIGNQNYEIPAGVDLSIYNSVEIWCQRFNSGFGAATLSGS